MAATDADAIARIGSRDPSNYLIGSPATIRARLNELAGAGADHLIVTFPHPTARADYETLAAATS
jgi:alkanesulfonate monooxygenase SsuD/methylene tetrahydromethanopterin reductase-like flavin-dependent oxidoreductase (luciferase family)